MKKTIYTAIFTSTLINPVITHAANSVDCTSEKSLAGHAHTMMKGGANLEQVLSTFGNQNSAKSIIESLFSNNPKIKNEKEAEQLGLKICKQNMNA